MKSLHELLKGKVVNCQTEEEAKEFLQFLHKNGYKWVSGNTAISKTYWEVYRNNTVYYFGVGHEDISYGDKWMVDKEKHQITTYQQFKQLINNENMETKEVKIQVPEGYEIDKENSTFELIKFKPIKKVLSYEDVAKELFFKKSMCYTSYDGSIINVRNCSKGKYKQPNNFTSEKQAQKLLAINKLMNVARYFNGDWQPDWDNIEEDKFYIRYNQASHTLQVGTASILYSDIVYFKSEKLAQQAIEILGEETVKLALSTDW